MREKADGDFVRRQNRLLVLETIRRYGPQARIELGRKTGLSPATITSITGDLMAEGMLVGQRAAATVRPGPGRPMQRLRLNGRAASVLGIEISIDGPCFTLASYDGTYIAQEARPRSMQRAGSRTFGATLAADARRFLSRHSNLAAPLQRAGVSVQGIADTRRGTIAWTPASQTRDIAIVEPLRRELGVGVTIANDTNLAAKAIVSRRPEAYAGAAAVVFLGYGVGMGLIMNGGVYVGPNGAAAEFGHMNHLPHGPLCRCGRRGCVEAFASDYGICRLAEGLDPSSPPPSAAIPQETLTAIAMRARAHERRAAAAFREAGSALGYGLARAIALLDLERVTFIGSGVSAFGLLEPWLREGLEAGLPAGLQRPITIEVEPSGQALMTDGLVHSLLSDVDRSIAARGIEAAIQMSGAYT